uniref:Uncharacterized protein n=1 Tax=Eutreptiella gymnastica TaxID=73025 RepID=A0A7S1NC12_9EUGL
MSKSIYSAYTSAYMYMCQSCHVYTPCPVFSRLVGAPFGPFLTALWTQGNHDDVQRRQVCYNDPADGAGHRGGCPGWSAAVVALGRGAAGRRQQGKPPTDATSARVRACVTHPASFFYSPALTFIHKRMYVHVPCIAMPRVYTVSSVLEAGWGPVQAIPDRPLDSRQS